MGRKIMTIVFIFCMFLGCSNAGDEYQLKPGTEPYKLAETLSKAVPFLNPGENNVLARTKLFTVTSGELITVMHQSLGLRSNQLKTLTAERLKSILRQNLIRLVEKKIILAEAERAGLTATRADIDSVFTQQYEFFGGEEAFNNHVSQNGLQMVHVIRDVEQGIVIDKYVDTIVGKDLDVDETELRKLYAEKSRAAQTASVRHILLMTEEKSDAEKGVLFNRMKALLKRAESGEDFAALAERYSEDPGSNRNGGLYEDFGRGEMVKTFDDAAFSVPVGSISDIIETQFGYHILKVEGRKGETRTFEVMRDELYTAALIEKKNLAYDSHLRVLKEIVQLEKVEF